jgi:hypothetical protein
MVYITWSHRVLDFVRSQTDPVSETLCSSVYRAVDEIPKLSNPAYCLNVSLCSTRVTITVSQSINSDCFQSELIPFLAAFLPTP